MNLFKLSIYVMIISSLVGCGSGSGTGTGGASYGFSSKADLFWSATGRQAGVYTAVVSDIKDITSISTLSNEITVVVVDLNGNLYWIDATDKIIYKSDAEGNNPISFITRLISPNGLALDETNNRLYYSDQGEVGYTSLNGGSLNTIIDNGLSSGGHLVINEDTLYIADLDASTIFKTGLEGGVLVKVVDADAPYQMVIDTVNNKLLYADSGTDSIFSVNLDDANKTVFLDFNNSLANPRTLAIDINEEALFFVTDNNNTLFSSDLEGTNINELSTKMTPSITSLYLLPEDE